MFERNRVDSTKGPLEHRTASVILDLEDGRRISGRIKFARTSSLIQALNGSAEFIEFVPQDADEDEILLAKSTIRSLRVVSAPKVKPIKPSAQAGDFDPHEVLGVDPGADRTAVREAFHRLSMRYHPDRYTAADLPEEVVDYLEAMARRVNAAYELLSAAVTACERHRAHRTGPIYQKASTTARA